MTKVRLEALASNDVVGLNRLINPHFAIDQRNAGASQTITAGAALAYTVDRWYAYCTGANVTGQRVAGTAPSQYAYKFTGLVSNTGVGFGQRIEQANCYDMQSLEASLSVWMTASTAKTITWTLSGPTTTPADTFGTIASPAITSIATGTWSITTTRTQFTANLTAAQMAVAAASRGLELRFTVPTLVAAETWTIEMAKLESGASVTPFVFPSVGQALLDCRRYTQKSQNLASAPNAAPGAGNSGVLFAAAQFAPIPIRFIPPVRNTPGTITIYDGAGAAGKLSAFSGSWSNGATASVSNISEGGMAVQNSSATSTQISFDYFLDAEMYT